MPCSKAFDPAHGTWGALDVAARISNVAVDSGVFKLGYANPNVSATNATEYAFGLNWYLNTNVKWQLDYARTYFNGGAGKNPKFPQDRPDEYSRPSCKSALKRNESEATGSDS